MEGRSVVRTTPLSATWALGIFAILSLLNLIAVQLEVRWLIVATKPLLMPALGLYFFLASDRTLLPKAFRLILFALFFSMLGDVFLLFSSELFFPLGLSSFLVAHCCYIRVFLVFQQTSPQLGLIRRHQVYALPLLLYGGFLIWFLWPDLPNVLRFPVLLYGVIITTMAVMALNLRGLITNTAFRYLFIGALLFVLSDSYLALNKFKTDLSLPLPGVVIMLTYLTGQFGIVEGSRKAIDTRDASS